MTCASKQTPQKCGAALQATLRDTNHFTVTICPGPYVGNFIVSRGVTVVGAGQGDNPATDTILSSTQDGRVITLLAGWASVNLEKLRVTDGILMDDYGAGIVSLGAGLTMTNCIVTGNQGSNVTGVGIYSQSALHMTKCEVSDNACTSGDEALAGGIYAQGPATLTDCQITGNSTSGEDSGLVVAAGTTTLAGQTTVNRNSAAGGGGILVVNGASLTVASTCQVSHNTATELYGSIANRGTVVLQGSSPATFVINTCPDNCLDVSGCTNAEVHCPV